MAFTKDFYGRKAEARQRIATWMESQRYRETKPTETPPNYLRYRRMTWKTFIALLRDEVAPPETVIEQKLSEHGLKEENGELVKA